ncbi:phosphonate transport system permease protein [Tissierella praeacuta DSM 18095]|uniref:Phosphonate transport system permease protein n=2 Tax=Tissierella praeacuta TaxID=43131 RepID=A0A1M4TA02_9FIRM|nr:phosphonate ABC transporter, permease protein PhnE [Tissierella praeacuta]SHE41291.1 phosphonate transport system permease protein [Tissierella praeacuta DSM 18095]SUP04815.1 Phosphate-import permease protein phnE [Tissierella praeacuta]
MIKSSKEYMTKRIRSKFLYLFGFIIFLVFLGFNVNFSFAKLYKGVPSMLDLISRILRPNLSYSIDVFEKLTETIQIAIISSILGVILALPFSLFVSDNIAPNRYLAGILNGIFSFFRTIPSLIWAALLVSIFSIGRFSGIIALTIIGFLISIRLFREYIESIKENQLNSIRAIGANSIQILRYCILPYIFELSISIFFIVLETNIRSATILGLVGAGGIGQIMWRDLNHLRYDNLATIILVLFLTILLIDFLSLYIRRYLKHSSIKFKSMAGYKRFQIIKIIFIPMFLIGLIYLAFKSLGIDYKRLILGLNQGKNIVVRMIKIDMNYFPKLIEGIGESFFIAIFATIIGGLLSLLFSYLTAYNTSPNKTISVFFKGIINISRTFPPLITAIIFFRGVGPGPLAGAMALSIYTTGVLTKMYSEVLENTKENVKDSILVTGATNFQAYRHGLLPHTFSTFISLLLYRLESNIRNSAILGVIGAGGIGTILAMNITWRNWEKVGLLLLGVSIMIIIIDRLSQYLRNKFS